MEAIDEEVNDFSFLALQVYNIRLITKDGPPIEMTQINDH